LAPWPDKGGLTDLVFLVVLRRLRYHLSLRNLAGMFLERGLTITHQTVHEWERRFALLPTERLRRERRGKAGHCRHCDETYLTSMG
jgi:putative transposase